MTVRTPLKLNGSDLQEMTAGEIQNIKDQCMYLYALSTSVDVTYVASGGGLGTIADTRFITGTSSVSATAFPTEATTSEPTITTVNYARMTQTTDNTVEVVDTSSIAFPVYQTSGNIQAMTLTDMYDTFINPTIDQLTDGTDRPGTYRIHTANTLAGHTLVNASPVFVDTKANLAGITAGEIGTAGTTQTDATTVTNYYLFVTNSGSAVAYPEPLYVRSADSNIQAFTAANFNAQLTSFMRHGASEKVGTRIRYNLNGTGNNRGSGMANTAITSTAGVKTDRLVNTDDYRSQEFPSGTATTQTTTFLRITQT